MGALLPSDRPVWERHECLVCHNVDASYSADHSSEFLADGVSCAACHGADKGWIKEHHGNWKLPKRFREMLRDDREREYGMTNVWNPARKAELCASCHVGHHDAKNPDQHKVVTHAMYAAGHPPLPGLEITAFSNQLPRHWQYVKEKPTDGSMYVGEEDLRRRDFEQTRGLLVGALVTFRASYALVAQEAAHASDEAWPLEHLARFDCYACHHELQLPSWRQDRPNGGAPGRPQVASWPTVLVRLAARHAGADEAPLNARLTRLADVCAERPFGSRQDVARASGQLVAWVDKQIAAVGASRIDDAAAHKLLATLCALGAESPVDYDTARQIVWAFQAIYNELHSASERDSGNVLKAVTSVEWQLPARSQRRVDEVLGTNLDRLNRFDQGAFQSDLGRLAPLAGPRTHTK